MADRVTNLTPWSRVLPEQIKCPKLLKKFPAFYETRRFITAYTTACPYPEPDQSSLRPPPNLSKIHFNLMIFGEE
jgi:hypothetical protein